MKRPVLLTAILAITLLVTASMVMAQTPSVPNLINFQGRLTDLAGNPVANGAHTVDFYIFPVRTGGGSVWNETQTPTTTGGLFTTQLGLVNPLPQTLFQDYDSLFLEIVADAQLISPRTLLSSTPFTRAAEGLEGQSPYNPSAAYIRTDPFGHQLSTYGADGLEQIRLWGPSWGEMYLFDFSPSNFLNFYATGENFPGGALHLGNGAGTYSLSLQGGAIGDASAILPTDAVNSGEILDEPGVSNSDNPGFFFLSTGAFTTYVIDSVDISIPAAGYVEVTNDGYLNLAHTTGTASSFYTTLSTTSGDFGIYAGTAVARVPDAIATSAEWAFTMSSSRLFAEGAAGTYRYYLMIRHETGTNTASYFNYTSIRAKYFPTLYGTVVLAKAGAGGNAVVSSTGGQTAKVLPNAEFTTITAADHNARLEAERAKQMAELEARIKKMEAEQASMRQSLQGGAAPRKER